MITVERIGFWSFGGGVDHLQKMVGQVTVCVTRDGRRFAVRENLDSRSSFNVNSGQRWGEKSGRISSLRQCLEVVSEDKSDQTELVKLVEKHDTKRRPAKTNRQFTWTWLNDDNVRWR